MTLDSANTTEPLGEGGGLQVNTEGTTTLTMSDGKVTGATGVGKGVYKRTYGPAISGYAGKTYTYTAKATGPVTFEIEVVND